MQMFSFFADGFFFVSFHSTERSPLSISNTEIFVLNYKLSMFTPNILIAWSRLVSEYTTDISYFVPVSLDAVALNFVSLSSSFCSARFFFFLINAFKLVEHFLFLRSFEVIVFFA